MSRLSQLNIIGRVSHFFTLNQSLSTLLLLAVILFGALSFLVMPKQYNPEIVRPAFLVSLQYEGATIEQSLNRVVYELVEKIDTIPGVDDVYTEVADGGTIETTVIFAVGHDTATAKLDLWSQLEQYNFLAEGFISSPHIIEINPETIPVLQVAFTSPTHTPAELREDVLRLSQALSAVKDVSVLSVHGGYESQVVVELEPERLKAAGVSIEQLVGSLQQAQVRTVTSGIRAGNYQIEAELTDSVESVADIGTIAITPQVRIRDVAHVYEGVAGDRSSVWYSDGKSRGEVVVLGVSKVEGSSAPLVTDAVLAAIDGLLQGDTFTHLQYQVVSNDGATASQEIYGLSTNLLTSIGIVSVVLMLFLSVRAALVVLVAIPVTLLIVFGLGWLFDETINRITLFALILSLGLLVDSAIVVVENIYAHLEEWKDNPSETGREQVIAKAVSEVGVGLVLSTITSVIVFLPMAYITGMMGPYMGPIAFFVPAALIISLLVAIVVTPFVALKILKGAEWRFALGEWFSARLDTLTRLYGRVLSKILASRQRQRLLIRSMLVLFIVSLILPATGLVHFQMLPKADRDQVYVYVDAPVDASVTATSEAVEQLSAVLHQNEYVTNIQAYIAEPPIVDFNGMFKGAQGRSHDYQATLRVNFVPTSERRVSSSELANDIRALVATEMPGISAYVRVMEEPPGPPVRATFVAKVSGENQQTQDAVASKLYEAISGVDGVTDRYLEINKPVARTRYIYDHEVAAELGVSLASVEQALALLSAPVAVTEYRDSKRVEQTMVMLTLPEPLRDAPTDISHVEVMSADGTLIPLTAVLTSDTAVRPSTITLEDATTITRVTAEAADRSIVYVTIDVMRLIMRGELANWSVDSWGLFGMILHDDETGEQVAISWGGEWEMTLENFRDLGIAMGVALTLVYGVLVAQYRRFATPAYILVTVPLGLVGILWGFFILDTTANIYLTATALIGFIALIGLVVNNAIIFLEYVEQALQAGLSYQEALLQAGQARLRPILLTSLTTVLGSLTIASDPVWSGLAWAIVFGLLLSTILTLIVYPTLLMYYTSEDYQN